MREIPLSRGLFALVDDEDYELLSIHSWYAHVSNGGRVYAARKIPIGKAGNYTRYGVEYMHHAIAGKPETGVVDHFNGNSLDNQRVNLRPVTQSTNVLNSTFGKMPGVFFCKTTGRYAARASRDSRRVFLGRFDTRAEAMEAVTSFRENRTKVGTGLAD